MSNPAGPPPDPPADRIETIHAAAIEQFSINGFSGTSMAQIADGAGMSRPALYQYFRNKEDIFTSAYTAMMQEFVDRALKALREPGSTADQLDGCLQQVYGNLFERTSTWPHADEIVDAKTTYAAAAIADVLAPLRHALDHYLRARHPGRTAAARNRRAAWFELLELSPRGFKLDEPPSDVFRRRLTALASSVAADIEAARPA